MATITNTGAGSQGFTFGRNDAVKIEPGASVEMADDRLALLEASEKASGRGFRALVEAGVIKVSGRKPVQKKKDEPQAEPKADGKPGAPGARA